jgi:hypothetical protein
VVLQECKNDYFIIGELLLSEGLTGCFRGKIMLEIKDIFGTGTKQNTPRSRGCLGMNIQNIYINTPLSSTHWLFFSR